MFICSMWDVKEPTQYSRRVGHEVPCVVAVLCECMDEYREVIYLARGLDSPCTPVQNWTKTGPTYKKR